MWALLVTCCKQLDFFFDILVSVEDLIRCEAIRKRDDDENSVGLQALGNSEVKDGVQTILASFFLQATYAI